LIGLLGGRAIRVRGAAVVGIPDVVFLGGQAFRAIGAMSIAC
jgi:hypothetical protein